MTLGLALATSGDEVWVAEGTYPERGVSPGTGVRVYGGFAGTETERTQRDWKAHPAVLDGEHLYGEIVSCRFEDTVVDGFTIRDSTIGVRVKGTATISNNTILLNSFCGVYVEGRATLSCNNIRWNTSDGVLVTGMATLVNNAISGTGRYGVECHFGVLTLYNNTICGSHVIGVELNGGTAEMVNNIVAFNGHYGIHVFGDIPIYLHNNVFGNAGGDYDSFSPPADMGNISRDPLFADWPNGDVRLQTISPCIDAGTDSVVEPGQADLNGLPRIVGAHVDIGACEHGSLVTPYTIADVARCLGIACGTQECTSNALSRLNVDAASPRLDLGDAVRLARKVSGLEANP